MTSAPWSFQAHLDVWSLVLLLGAGYVLVLRRERKRRVAEGSALEAAEEPATRKQKRLFFAGLACLWIGADWPIHDVAEGSLYSVHMLQHMIFSLAAAPLLLMGTPDWLFRALIRPRWIHATVKVFSRPFGALIGYNAILVFTHWPVIVTASVGNEPLHFGLHVLLFASAISLWMPVCSPVMEIPRPSLPGQMLYLFLQSLVPTVPASFLTFGRTPLYSIYVDMPKLWGISPLTDQRAAGLLMKIAGGFVLWGVIAGLWFKWWKIEQSEGIDLLAYRNVDRQLDRGMMAAGAVKKGPVP